MALLGTFVYTTTNAGIAAAGSSSYAHGLPSAPHLVSVWENATTNSTTAIKLAWASDATNISIYNHGQNASSTLNVFAQVVHSVAK